MTARRWISLSLGTALAAALACSAEDGARPPESFEGARTTEASPASGAPRFVAHAAEATRVGARGAEVTLRLHGARPAPREATREGVVYRDALPDADVEQRAVPGGIEDSTRWRRPPAEAVERYSLRVTGAAGLRLVSSTLELLNERGAPLLRVGPVRAFGARGDELPVAVALRGCAYDASPVAPWHRAVTPPGAEECELEIRWAASDGDYPVLVDPPWVDAGTMLASRALHTATRLADGTVLVVGGGAASAEIYDPVTRTWAATGAPSGDRVTHAAALLGDGTVLIVGGRRASASQNSAELYRPALGTFAPAAAMAHPRAELTLNVTSSGRALAIGGYDTAVATDATDIAQAEAYDPSAGTWSTAGSLLHARRLHTATTLANGDVLVVAGYSRANPVYLNTAERWSASTGQFTAAGSFGNGRIRHSATLLDDGRVLVVGGRLTAITTYDDVWAYQPSNGTWTQRASLTLGSPGRCEHGAALLPDGRVAVLGGSFYTSGTFPPGADLVDAQFYTPASNVWTRTSDNMSAFRRDASSTLLGSGNVLIAGAGSAEELCLGAGCPCTSASECYSGYCVDGVCCDQACTAHCTACSAAKKGGGSDGWCEPVLAGRDPGNECSADAPGTCQQDGTCDGSGGCRLEIIGTPCGSPTCLNPQQESRPDACDGNGQCVAQGIADCGAYKCLGAGCLSSCLTAAECADGYSCVAGQCRKRPNGASCSVDADCESTFCVAGSCCNSACEGQCEACNASGVCAPVTGSPPAGKPACSGEGPCAARCDGNDPSACTAPGREVTCGDGKSCQNGECVQTSNLCSSDRSSSLPAGGDPVSCAPYLCDSSSGDCATTCSASSQCASGWVCSAPRCVRSGGTAEDDSGCAVSAPGSRGGGTWLAALGVIGWWARRARARRRWALGAALAALPACSAGDDRALHGADDVLQGSTLAPSSVAAARLAAVRGSLRDLGSLLGANPTVFEDLGARIRVHAPPAVDRSLVARADLELPRVATEATHLVDRASGVALSFALEGARPSAIAVADGLALYPGAAPGGGDVAVRASAEAVEDFVTLPSAPARAELAWTLDVTRVAGLRLVSNVLELLDAGGSPRLRVQPPWIADRDGTQHAADLDVDGCAVDTSPRVPMGRAVTPPGSARCRVIVRWDGAAVRYPAVLDPTWTTTSGMIYSGVMAIAALPDGSALLSSAAVAQVYANNLYTATANPSADHSGGTLTRLTSGSVLLVGGGTTTAVQRWNPATGAWTNRAALPAARTGQRATLLDDGTVLVTGGGLDTATRYDNTTNTWTAAGSIGSRARHAATLMPDGRVLVTGGGTLATTTLYDPTTNAWTASTTMREPRVNHVAALLPDGRVLVAGGDDTTAPGGLDTAELRSRTSGAWTYTTALPHAYRQSVAVPFANGSKIYLVPGRGASAGTVDDTRIFDVATLTWQAGGTLTYARLNPAAVLLANGYVLTAGGEATAHVPPYYGERVCADYGCPCTTQAQCVVGTCTDGVCCDQPCSGTCEACTAALKLGGSDGVCEPIPAGSDPGDECPDGTAATCGTVGTCSGAGACTLYPSGTECAAASCQGSNVRIPASTCDGAGLCVAALAVTCSPGSYCDAGACASGCQVDGDCLAGFECHGGLCTKRANGAACALADECASGFCADGVCCEAACTGQCESCSEAGTEGVCLAVSGAPRGARAACDGSGPCAGSCGSSRTACAYPGADTSCAPGSTCSNGACTQTSPFCSDTATSQPVSGAAVDCAPYACDADTGACGSRCDVSDDCTLGNVCVDGVCTTATSGSGGTSGTKVAASDDGGCSCRASGSRDRSSSAWALAALFALAARRRRRA